MFEVIGTPRGKGRPRFYNAGKFIKTYTPKDTASYENLVKLSYVHAANAQGFLMIEKDRPVKATVNCLFEIPASWSKKRRSQAVYCTKKPDCDNIAKVIMDALNGIAFHDDSQVVCLTVHKQYVINAEQGPKCIVYLEPI
jgi:Holliday junction resolvase RusA-like endonuclease